MATVSIYEISSRQISVNQDAQDFILGNWFLVGQESCFILMFTEKASGVWKGWRTPWIRNVNLIPSLVFCLSYPHFLQKVLLKQSWSFDHFPDHEQSMPETLLEKIFFPD